MQSPERIHPALWRATQLAQSAARTLPTGHAALSAELPDGGWPLGSLIELMAPHPGIGEIRLLRPALAQLETRRAIALVQPPHAPHIASWMSWRLDPRQLLWVAPEKPVDALWAAEQILKNGSCGALICWLPHVRPESLRRLHLAAQASDLLFIAVRPSSAAQKITMKCIEKLVKRIPAMYPRPLAAEDVSAYADGAAPPARVRVYAALGRTTTLYTDAACREDYRDRIDVKYNNAGDKGVLGIPVTETLRSKENERFSTLSYQEYEVPGGKPLIFEARFDASSRVYCDGKLSGQFVARPGQDYEVEFEVADEICRLHIRQVHADGSMTPQQARATPTICERTRAPVRIEPRQEMQVLLFSAGEVQIQDASQSSAPQRLSDDAGSSQALQQMLQQASSTPGTRLCVVVPAADYSSVLHDAVRERVLDAPQVLPSLWEETSTVNQRRNAAADAPVDIAAAVTRCKAFPIKEFAAQ